MVIKLIKDSNPKGYTTFGEWFDNTIVMPSMLIANWEDVISNIKVSKHRSKAEYDLSLFGYEYPSDTPLYVDESITEGYKPKEEGTDGTTGEQ
tara:strand:- start:3860 stop:4138 length:279 start_codon:yes stop_codon:yes gene_type:complete